MFDFLDLEPGIFALRVDALVADDVFVQQVNGLGAEITGGGLVPTVTIIQTVGWGAYNANSREDINNCASNIWAVDAVDLRI